MSDDISSMFPGWKSVKSTLEYIKQYNLNKDTARKMEEWEKEKLPEAETIKLFQELVESGVVWRLPIFGSQAYGLIRAGLVHYPDKLVTEMQKYDDEGNPLPTQKEYLEGRKREEEEFWKLQQHQKLAAQAPKVKQQMIIHPPRLSIPLLERVPNIVVIPSQNNTLPAKENITMKELEHAEDAIKKLSRVRKLERVKA